MGGGQSRLGLQDVAVLENQLTRETGEITWRKVDTVNAFEDEVRALAETMG